MTTTTKLDRAINFLCLLHPLITRSEGEIINSDNNINTNNSNDYNIYNDRQSYNITTTTTTTTTTISIPSTKQAEQLLLRPFAKRILIIDDDPHITLTFKKGLEA
jgi:hypothetical protein